MNYFSDLISQAIGHLPINLTVLAVNITNPDVVGQIQKVWNNFVQTGQIWALVIGLVIGYMFRNLTKYG